MKHQLLQSEPMPSGTALDGSEWGVAGADYGYISFPLWSAPLVGLTKAEREVAERVAGGMSPGAIARQRLVSRRTVEHQLCSAYRKLGVASREELLGVVRDGESW